MPTISTTLASWTRRRSTNVFVLPHLNPRLIQYLTTLKPNSRLCGPLIKTTLYNHHFYSFTFSNVTQIAFFIKGLNKTLIPNVMFVSTKQTPPFHSLNAFVAPFVFRQIVIISVTPDILYSIFCNCNRRQETGTSLSPREHQFRMKCTIFLNNYIRFLTAQGEMLLNCVKL